MASRNRFSRAGGPLRTVQLADPFATMVANINKQLAYLQQQKALAALAAGDPDGFLKLAQNVLKTVTGDEKALWEDLIKKAESKIEETAWATEVSSGRASLEDFRDHLKEKLAGEEKGSQAAYEIITALDGVNKGIAARDQAKQDQAALTEYIDTNDHLKYASYLTKKLQATTDPATFNTLRNQIEELKARDANENQVKRVRARGEALSAYLDGNISAASAIQKLQELALDPKITATEVSALQTLVTQIHDREEQKARAGSAAAGANYGLNPQAFLANYETYKQDRANVEQIIKDGGDPTKPVGNDKQSPLDKLRASASVLTDQYHVAASSAAAQNKVDTAAKYAADAQEIQTHLGEIPGRVDKKMIEDATGTTLAQFNANVKDMKTTEGRAVARVERIKALSAVAPNLKTDGERGKVTDEINSVASDYRGDVANLQTEDVLSAGQKRDLDNDYRAYTELAAKQGVQPVKIEQFMQAAVDASKKTDPTEIARVFAQKTNLKLDPQYSIFGNNFGGEANRFTGQSDTSVRASDIVKQVAEIANQSTLLDNQKRAGDLTRTLLQTPGGVPFGPPGSIEYQIMGLQASDVARMRVQAGITTIDPYAVSAHGAQERADMAMPPGQMPTTSGAQMPQGPGFGADAFNAMTGGGGKSPSLLNEEDLTSYENSSDELRQELRLQRESQKQMEQDNQPSIEDTLLATTPPPMDLSVFMNEMGIDMSGNNGDPYAGMEPAWAAAMKTIDEPANVDVTPFQIAPLPDMSPFQSDLPSPNDNPFSGSDPGGPPDMPDLPSPDDYAPMPSSPTSHGNY